MRCRMIIVPVYYFPQTLELEQIFQGKLNQPRVDGRASDLPEG
jgi:hypothetical protein